MAELLDERLEEIEEVEQPTEEQAVVEQPPEEELPDKYQGKSLQEVVRMHQEAERLAGRQSQEVGDLRKQVDQIIQTQLTQAPQEPEEDVDFFLDPKRAVEKAIESHPKIKEAEAAAESYKKTAALSQLQQNHPDMQKILQDAAFGEWVQKSRVRTRLFQQADSQYDYESADELFSLWKERQELASNTVAAEQASRKQQIQQATTGSVRGSGEPPSKKVYRRADIMKLMKEDPQRYEAMGDEILLAYQQGRVK